MVHQEYFSKMKKTAAMLNLWVKFVGEIDFVPQNHLQRSYT